MHPTFRVILIATVVLWTSVSAEAVVLYRTPRRNTAPPPGSLASAGWQWEGEWGSFLGTAIGKNTFVTAEHVGGAVGEFFTLNGVRYKTVATWDDPNSDLQIWSVRGRFSSYAPVLKTLREPGKAMVVYGRGTQRGDPVVLNGTPKGWLWGNDDHVQSWGMNVINGSSTGRSDSGTKIKGAQLYWTFDRIGSKHESGLSAGDSGGGVFIQTGDTWSLAGVNFAAQSEFSLPGDSTVLHGSLFDYGGMMIGDRTVGDTTEDIPAASFATRVALRAQWIHDVQTGVITPSEKAGVSSANVSMVPEPGMLGALLIGSLSIRRRRATLC